jgi:hypothetical protein
MIYIEFGDEFILFNGADAVSIGAAGRETCAR